MFVQTKLGQIININQIETITFGEDTKTPEGEPRWRVLAAMASGQFIPLEKYNTREEAKNNVQAELSSLIFSLQQHQQAIVPGRMIKV